MDVCNEDGNVTSVQPIAIGPCMLYKRYPKSRTSWLRTLFARTASRSRSSSEPRLIERGKWVDSFLTLYSDSTMCLRDGSCERDAVVTSVKLVDVYRNMMFGEGFLFWRLAEEMPAVDSKYLSSMLAVPSEPHCNSQMTWLFFFSHHTLNKWLVAFCKSIPADMLNDPKISRACRPHEKHAGKASPNVELKKHIRLFFPLPTETDAKVPGSDVTANERVTISALPKLGRTGKKRAKHVQKISQGSRKIK